MMLAITIDMDGPAEYAAIHGVPPPDCDPVVMYAGPLERFAALCHQIGGPGTVFVIGRDLGGSISERLRELAERGFEVASHSAAHDYQLSRLPPMHIEDDLAHARAAHERELGTAPQGFRAPGHHTSSALLDALETTGFAYSSSVLPSPPYYAAKALVLGGYRLLGRASHAMLGSPRMPMAPRAPYRPGRNPYSRGDRALVELPMSVATPARLPVTGASLVLAPTPVRRIMVRALCRQPTIVLNLHAMDLVDSDRDGLPRALVERQPELRTPLPERMHILGAVLEELAAAHPPITCTDVAARV